MEKGELKYNNLSLIIAGDTNKLTKEWASR